MSDRPSRTESARLLRQRLEMGASEVFLGGMTRAEALEHVRAAVSLSGAESVPARPEAAVRAPAASVSTASAGKASSAVDGRPGSPPKADASARKGVQAPGRAPTGALPVLSDSYEELRTQALACTSCRLAEGRTQVVFSDGPSNARLMVVGEAPGANEDASGVPFVGAAGQYLDLLLATVGLSREESVYIANVLKCRPPGNRDPLPDEIETCSPFLRKQIDLVRPEALLAVGSFSGKLLTGQDKVALGKLRGRVHSYHGVPLVVTYHPAALLRNPNWTQLFWDDLQLLREVMDAA